MNCIGMLERMDKCATLWLNYDGGWFQDWLWSTVTTRMIWLPVALLFLFLLSRQHKGWRTMVATVLGIVLTVAICDQLSASVCKPFFMRLRPSHAPELCGLLHHVGGYRGGLYGFVSSHASNAFGVFAYTSMTMRRRWFTAPLLLFVSMVAYSRIYLGVHYLGDVIGGAILGLAVGATVFFVISRANFWISKRTPTQWLHIRIYNQGNVLGMATKVVLLTILCSATVAIKAHTVTPTDSICTSTDSISMSTDSLSTNTKNKTSASQLYQSTYIAAPLIVGGLIMKGEDTHFRRLRNDYLPRFNRHVDDYMQYAPAAIMLGMKVAGVESRSSWKRMLVSDAFSTAIMAGVVNTLKTTTQVERPDGSNRHSFPSGHTATAFMTATMLTKEYGHISPWIGIGAYSVASATGLMRMANNKHWLSDVMTGAGIGIMSTELGYFIADMVFKDRGINSFDKAEKFSLSDRPSFLSLYLGANIPLSGYDIDEENEFRTSSGSVAGIEGAYFFNPYIGVGGRFAVSNTSIIVNDVEAEDNTFDAVLIYGGGYFSYPLSPRWALGSKLLCGYVHYPKLELARQTVPTRSRIGFGSGLSLSYRAGNGYSMRLFLDYNLQPSHSRGSGEWMNVLTLGTSFAISL